MGQPTPEQDRRNGTVSAINTPDVDEVFAPSGPLRIAGQDDEFPEATYTDEDPEVAAAEAAQDADASARESAFEESYAHRDDPDFAPDEEFTPTSDEAAPNVGHVPYVEPVSDTPVYDSTKAHRDPTYGWNPDDRA